MTDQQKVLDFAKSKTNRYFEFKNKEALENISFFDYDTNLIDEIQIQYDVKKAIEIIHKDKDLSISLPDDKMKAFAHVLFNNGYLTGESDCWGGMLEFVDRTKGDR